MIEIKHIRCEYHFGRPIMLGQLTNIDDILLNGTLAQILQYAKSNNLKISNTQDILNIIVLESGFAS